MHNAVAFRHITCVFAFGVCRKVIGICSAAKFNDSRPVLEICVDTIDNKFCIRIGTRLGQIEIAVVDDQLALCDLYRRGTAIEIAAVDRKGAAVNNVNGIRIVVARLGVYRPIALDDDVRAVDRDQNGRRRQFPYPFLIPKRLAVQIKRHIARNDQLRNI